MNKKIWGSFGKNIDQQVKDLKYIRELSGQINYENGIAEAYLNEGWCQSHACNEDLSMSSFHKSWNLYHKINHTEGELKAINGIGSLYLKP